MQGHEKSHDTGLRILEILKILLEEDLNKETLIKKLKSKKEIGNALSHEAYIKYFNTFDEIGLKIKKINGKYSLLNAPFQMDLTEDEIRILTKLIQSVYKLHNRNQETTMKNFFIKSDKFFDFDIRKTIEQIENAPHSNSVNQNIINTLEQMMHLDMTTRITYKKSNGQEETLDVELKQIKEKNGIYYAICYNQDMIRNKRICINSITEIKQGTKKATGISSKSAIIFEVYGRLSKSYRLKDGEILTDFGNNFIRISNTKEDIETLLPRLLKYGENCKIIKPQKIVDEFLTLTDDILKNLEVGLCQK